MRPWLWWKRIIIIFENYFLFEKIDVTKKADNRYNVKMEHIMYSKELNSPVSYAAGAVVKTIIVTSMTGPGLGISDTESTQSLKGVKVKSR